MRKFLEKIRNMLNNWWQRTIEDESSLGLNIDDDIIKGMTRQESTEYREELVIKREIAHFSELHDDPIDAELAETLKRKLETGAIHFPNYYLDDRIEFAKHMHME